MWSSNIVIFATCFPVRMRELPRSYLHGSLAREGCPRDASTDTSMHRYWNVKGMWLILK